MKSLSKKQLKIITGGVFPFGGVVNFPSPNYPNPSPVNSKPFPPLPQPVDKSEKNSNR